RRAAAGLAVPPLDSSACGAFVDVDVPVKLRRGGRVRRPGKVHLPVTARSSITPRTDRDNAMLVCLPAGSVPSPAACPRNPDGPNEPVLIGKSAGTLEITLPLTTGTSTLAPEPGAKPETPCVRQPGEPAGVTPAPDMCRDGGVCTAGGCAGPQTCARRGIDASTGEAVCIDAKGGTSQYCCSNDPGRACQPTRAGNPIGVVERVGHAETPR